MFGVASFGLNAPEFCVEVSLGEFVVSKANLLAESTFSTALLVPSGFIDRRFETAPDLSFSKHKTLVLAKLK
ncbi:hypothetical protein BJL74_22690 [Vibrio parahaemolyticus]|uniref:hypothetical protein n=1 Tax=Vibrio parahaemolyticus TaxID=670 RepID=UPI00099716DB|nr:hypothetical protein BJL74_22690 [Vibrio parahaemolyticus]